MKKIYLLLLIGAIFQSYTIVAQERDSAVTLPTVTITSISKVEGPVDRSFRSTFPNAKRARWYKVNKDYLAKFIKDDLKHQSLFAKNGFIKYDITYGSEKQLPESVNTQINSSYSGYNVTNVAKVSRYEQDFWIVNLESLKDYVVLRAEDGELQEVKRYNRAD